MNDVVERGECPDRGFGMCKRCQGNGEIVTDWDRYMRGPLDENGEDVVAPCPDCDGTGQVDPALADASPDIGKEGITSDVR